MHPNPVLRQLGLGDDDRAVIIHADDVGMCQASLAAYADLVDFGLVSSASTMVPCPWFPAVAAFCRDRSQDHVDMGVHLTLTSEFEGYRWGPISTRDLSSGLIDREGHFFAESEAVQARGNPDAVQREIEAQVQRAVEAGVDVTHIDTHMGTVAHARFLPVYIQVALQYRVPPLLLRLDEAGLRELDVGIDAETSAMFAGQVRALEAQGLPLLDGLQGMPLDQPAGRLEQAKRALAALPAGVTYLIIHPARDTPELRAITPDWRGRVADYETFTSDALAAHVRDCGVHVIGWRALRDLMRGGELRDS
jgi:predicted glycoside hydrolase/deacetylase ChbG (UPF0249 family)